MPMVGTRLSSNVDSLLTENWASNTPPPREEFPPFTVPNLCQYDPLDYGEFKFFTFPEDHGWVVHHKDTQCHPRCSPTGICFNGKDQVEADHYYKSHGPVSPMLSRVDGTAVTPASKATFIQAWLFFGTLHEMSRMYGLSTVDIQAEFIVNNGTGVSTAALNGMARRWFVSLSSDKVGDIALMEDVISIARQMVLLLHREVSSRPACEPTYQYTADEACVLFSTNVLLQVLQLHLIMHIDSPAMSEIPEDDIWDLRARIFFSLSFTPDWAGFEGSLELNLLEDMTAEARGWCRSELERPWISYFMDGLKLSLSRQTVRNHAGCTYTMCLAYQVDEATYRTAHTSEECNCDFVGVKTEDLVEKLAADQVPLVTITDESQLQVVSGGEYSYIALSHVWADGLGNPKENALPRCQLRRIHDYVTRLRHVHGRKLGTPLCGPITFWMDTLCIPVDPCFKKYRRKAIHLMAVTFQEATAVLVLDKELQVEPISAYTTSFHELGIRILRSGWMKRVWTWEEAVFSLKETTADGTVGGTTKPPAPPRLYFQMCDGPFHLWEFFQASMFDVRIWPQASEVLIDDDIVKALKGKMAFPVDGERWESSIASVLFLALYGRMTSKAEDIPVCAASVLGVDIAPILDASGMEDRLAALYRLLPSIPEEVLWVEDQSIIRLSDAPFRWAPMWFNAMPAHTIDRIAHSTQKGGIRCDDQGKLHVRYSGLLLDSNTLDGRTLLFSVDATNGKKQRIYGQIQRRYFSWSSENNSKLSQSSPPMYLEHNDSYMAVQDEGYNQDDALKEVEEYEEIQEEYQWEHSVPPDTMPIEPSDMGLAIIPATRHLAQRIPHWINAAILRIEADADGSTTNAVEEDGEDEEDKEDEEDIKSEMAQMSLGADESVRPTTEINATIIGYGFFLSAKSPMFRPPHAPADAPRIRCAPTAKMQRWCIT